MEVTIEGSDDCRFLGKVTEFLCLYFKLLAFCLK